MIQKAQSLFWYQDKIHPVFPLCIEGAERKISAHAVPWRDVDGISGHSGGWKAWSELCG